MNGQTAQAPAGNGNSPQQQAALTNAKFRRAVVNNAIKIVQPLQSQVFAPGSSPTISFVPRNVGLLIGFYMSVSVAMTGTVDGSSAFPIITQQGPASLLTNISFTDFNNYQRINCPGWYLAQVNSFKARRPFASCMSLTSYPIAYGNNMHTVQAPAALSASPQTVSMLYYVPIAYSDWDLRGAIYSAVTGGQMQLQVTPNAAPYASSGAYTPNNMYYSPTTGGSAVYSGNMTVDVYQVFYDQLPTISQNGTSKVVVPPLDLATTYELKQTTLTGIAANQENTQPFSNYREFLSTSAIYQNGNAPSNYNPGTDISYWALQAANLLYIFKKEPFLVQQESRDQIGLELPPANYYFSTRDKPINTQQYGNMNLVINPTTVNNGAVVYIGYETFAQQNVVLGAQAFASA